MILDDKLNELDKAFIKTAERSKAINGRLDELEGQVKGSSSLAGDIKELAVEMKYLRCDLNDAVRRISVMECKEGEKWEKFKWIVATGIVTLVLGFMAIKLGLK